MRPLKELISQALSSERAGFVTGSDVLLAELYEKGRDFRTPPLSPAGLYQLVARDGADALSVGRENGSPIHLGHAAVSRLQLQLTRTDLGWFVVDRSTNGTWQHDQRLPAGQLTRLEYGAPLRLARAMVLWMVTAESFWQLARTVVPGQPPSSPPARSAKLAWGDATTAD